MKNPYTNVISFTVWSYSVIQQAQSVYVAHGVILEKLICSFCSITSVLDRRIYRCLGAVYLSIIALPITSSATKNGWKALTTKLLGMQWIYHCSR